MAARFWVGGTGTWDNTDTSHWATTSGGASGAAVPTSSDTVTFDGSSGGGTVTVAATINGTNTITSITMGAFTGTMDFSVNNPTINFTGTSQIFSVTGTGTRALKTGTATFNFDGPTGFNTWDFTTTTNLTPTMGSETTNIGTRSSQSNIIPNTAVTFGTINVNVTNNGCTFVINGLLKAGTLNLNSGNIAIANSVTHVITNLNVNGSASTPIVFAVNANTPMSGGAITATNFTGTYGTYRGLVFTNPHTSSNSFSMGGNTNLTVNNPPVSVIGG